MDDIRIKSRIIRYFYDREGSYVSGEEISGSLGFSRASLWKHIEKLREEGFEIEAAPHLGYRLRARPDKIFGYSILNMTDGSIFNRGEIFHFERTGSTNNIAYELAESGAPEGSIILSETQTGGKGRMGRKWVSPAGGIYFSVVLRPNLSPDDVPSVTIIAGFSLVNAIAAITGLKAGVKWPNDVYIGKKKVAGILAEMKAEPDKVDFLVLGMGINVNTAANMLPDTATSLRIESSLKLDRNDILVSLLDEFEKNYTRFLKEGFGALREECRGKMFFMGEKVRVAGGKGALEGIAADIDEKGSLEVITGDGDVRKICSGDVTARG